MRKISVLLLACVLGVSSTHAQTNTFPSTGAAGIGTVTPDASSLLDVTSTTKGILIPRMTLTQRNAIVSPATGLMVYQTNSTPGFYCYSGSAWVAVSPKGVNRSLSNLTSPTAINADLLPNADNTINIGSPVLGWKGLYFSGSIYSNGNRFISTDASNTWLGLYTGSSNSGIYNSAVGHSALYSNTSGSSNTAIGYGTLYTNSTGSTNIAIGQAALYLNTTGSGNTASGFGALYNNISGLYNNAYGYYSLFHNTTGYSNIAIGTAALYSNSTGHNLVAIGDSALYNQTTNGVGNYFNTAVGSKGLYSNTTGSRNTANGYQALYSNTTGNSNDATGVYSLFHNTTGYSNTAMGIAALYSNTTGHNLVAVGDSALYNQTINGSGSYYNTAIGSKALYSNTGGYQNTASGAFALYSNLTGVNNTATGNYALYKNTMSNNTGTGHNALYSNTTGPFNTADGVGALYWNISGEGNTATGYNALITNVNGGFNTALGVEADVSMGSLVNATAVGFGAIVDASNKVRIGNSDVTSIGGKVGWTTFPSDGRYKKNIKEDVKGLSFITSLRPITYTVDMIGLNAYFDKGRKHGDADEKMKVDMQASEDEASQIIYNGFIAQEVEAAAKKLNYNFSGVDKPKTEDGLYGLRYSDFVVPLVKAVQELSKKNDELEAMNDELKRQNDAQKNINIDLENRLANLETMLNAQRTTNYKQQTTNITDASLQQNIPNPFNHATTINYSLPQQYSSAKIIVVDKSGKMLKEINISGSGKGSITVDASTLASGAYNYSLYVDGRLIETKQMEHIK